jgi:hypothetical protein
VERVSNICDGCVRSEYKQLKLGFGVHDPLAQQYGERRGGSTWWVGCSSPAKSPVRARRGASLLVGSPPPVTEERGERTGDVVG